MSGYRAELAADFDRKDALAQEPLTGTWTIGAENANVRTITFQILDANGAPVKRKQLVKLNVWATTGQAALATGGSTGIAAGSGSVLVATHTAKLVFEFLTDANGLLTLTWTDTGTESVCLEIIYGAMKSTLSAAFANA